MPLTKTYEALEHIANIKGSRAKEALVNEYLSSIGREFYLTIKYALEPTMKFNVTGIPTVKYYFETASSEDIFSLLKKFSQQAGVNNEQKKHLSMYCPNTETRDVVHRILEGNLRCGVGKEIAKKFIPDFTDPAVQLCYHRAEYLKKYDKVEGSLNTFVKKAGGWKNVIAHIKLDGTRIKTVKGNHFSRSGLHVPFYKFMNDEIDLFRTSLKKVLGYTNDFVFELDGEYMYEGELNSTATDFSSIKNIDIDKLYYHVFDIPNLYLPLKQRLEAIEKAVKESGCKKIRYIETFPCTDYFDMLRLFKEVIEDGYEGLILKDKSGHYDPKKSGQWCKFKEMETEDVKVLDVVAGKGKCADMVGTFICEYKGQEVSVGKGRATEKELKEFLKNPPSVIEVKFQEETPDGKLRFPVYYRNRSGDKG